MRRPTQTSGYPALLVAAVLLGFAGTAQAQQPSAANLENQELDKGSAKPLKPGANSFAEGQARALLEAEGFTNVSALVNDKEGIWRGTATKNDHVMDVSVDFQGRVAAK